MTEQRRRLLGRSPANLHQAKYQIAGLSLLRGGDWQGFSRPMGSRTVMDIRQMDPPRSEFCCGVRFDLSGAPQSRSNGSILQISAPPRVLLRCAVAAWNAATLQACCGLRVATIVPPATSGPPVAVASCRTRCLECDQWSLRPAGCRFRVRGREIPAVNSSTRSRSHWDTWRKRLHHRLSSRSDRTQHDPVPSPTCRGDEPVTVRS